ncbi:hypothetical protein [Actinomyces faecalis]|uniref:hypothetical protein n=1 Tax=Actinomyces faecalis TaxID=2722820 RepID=UPI00155219F7|nr:hypothetical protein [Actinomyces faecalis]
MSRARAAVSSAVSVVLLVSLWPVVAVCAAGVRASCVLRDRRDEALARAERAWMADYRPAPEAEEEL